MDGLPVTVRLLDPPLHEHCPRSSAMSCHPSVAGDSREKDQHDIGICSCIYMYDEMYHETYTRKIEDNNDLEARPSRFCCRM